MLDERSDLAPLKRYDSLTPFLFRGERTTRGSRHSALGDLYLAYLPRIREAGGFRTGGRLASQTLASEVLSSFGSRRFDRALDLASGIGSSSGVLQQLAGDTVAVDLSHAQLKESGHEHRVRADAGTLPFKSESFDLVWCEDAMSHFYERAAAIRECWRVLEPGGVFAFFDLVISGLSPKRAARFQECWDLVDLESSDSYTPTLQCAGFAIVSHLMVGRRFLAAQLSEEEVMGIESPKASAGWIRRSRSKLVKRIGHSGVTTMVERLRMYDYLADGRLDYFLAVCIKGHDRR